MSDKTQQYVFDFSGLSIEAKRAKLEALSLAQVQTRTPELHDAIHTAIDDLASDILLYDDIEADRRLYYSLAEVDVSELDPQFQIAVDLFASDLATRLATAETMREAMAGVMAAALGCAVNIDIHVHPGEKEEVEFYDAASAAGFKESFHKGRLWQMVSSDGFSSMFHVYVTHLDGTEVTG